MKRVSVVSLVLLFVCSLSNTSIAKPLTDFSELDRTVPAELKEQNTPGAVITVISGSQIVYQKAFGVSNVETNVPMQPEMLFRLGSTTKMFTAAALVTLAEQGRVKLTEPIGHYVKGLSPKVSQTTAGNLLSHSAGFRDFSATLTSNDDSALKMMVHSWNDDVLFADQNEIYSYSSPAYWLAGYVIEEISGKPYADAMNELLFAPLGMERTTLRPFTAITYPFATGHAVEEGRAKIIRPMFNNVAMWPAGSMFTNAKDLSRFVIALLNDGKVEDKQLLTRSLISELELKRIDIPGEADSFYAYGLTSFKYKGLQFIGHGGFSRGYGSMIQMVPSRKFAVIVLTNKSGETMRKTLNKAFELGLELKDDSPAKANSFAAPTVEEMNEYVGTYKHAPTIWEVSVKNGKLNLKLEGKDYLLTKSGDRKFTFGDNNENELVFVPGKSGKISFLFSELYAAKKVN